MRITSLGRQDMKLSASGIGPMNTTLASQCPMMKRTASSDCLGYRPTPT